MSRELKFRAWIRCGEWEAPKYDAQEFMMIYPDSLTLEEHRILFEQLKGMEDFSYYMQFTGLVDENGKDVYEGDILKIVVGTKQIVRYCEVVWNNESAGFGVVAKMAGYCESLAEALDDCGGVVVGNIYQNPEILKL